MSVGDQWPPFFLFARKRTKSRQSRTWVVGKEADSNRRCGTLAVRGTDSGQPDGPRMLDRG